MHGSCQRDDLRRIFAERHGVAGFAPPWDGTASKEPVSCNKSPTLSRYRGRPCNVLRTAPDEWDSLGSFPVIRLLSGEVGVDRRLTRDSMPSIATGPPRLAARARFALATGRRAIESRAPRQFGAACPATR